MQVRANVGIYQRLIWKKSGPPFVKNLVPFTEVGFVPILVEMGSVVLNKKLSLYFHHLSSITPNERGQSPPFENS